MAWELLLKSDFGLMSLMVLIITIVMAIYYAHFFAKKMNEKPDAQ